MKFTDERTGTIKWQTFAVMFVITSICLIAFVFALFSPDKRNGIESRLVVASVLILLELFIYSFWWLNETLRARQFNTLSTIYKSLPPVPASELTRALRKQFPELKYEISALEQERFKMMVCSYGHPYQIEKMKVFADGWLEARK